VKAKENAQEKVKEKAKENTKAKDDEKIILPTIEEEQFKCFWCWQHALKSIGDNDALRTAISEIMPQSVVDEFRQLHDNVKTSFDTSS
jgi:hypothetical protein